jgi:hypothetical protein
MFAPYGYCQCGCGEKTNLVIKTNRKLGTVKGEPRRFVKGHRQRHPVINGEKKCNKCGLKKSLDRFGISVKNRDGHKGTCKDCVNKEISQRREDPQYKEDWQRRDRERYQRLAEAAHPSEPKGSQERYDMQCAPDKTVVTYFIQDEDGGPVKIGKTTRDGIPERLRAIQTGNPHHLVICDVWDGDHEAILHHFFAKYRKPGGEWFEPAPELIGPITNRDYKSTKGDAEMPIDK